MIIIKQQDKIIEFLINQKGQSIGFVPTMGALHKGHLSLMERAKRENDLLICSIFVNPTQFNDKNDWAKYPKPIEQDILMLNEANCDILFLPDVQTMYPKGAESFYFDSGHLDKMMEGKTRPGHFQGMLQIVDKLLKIVLPDKLYMGQKDFQQFKIVENFLQKTNSSIQLIMCPTVREEDGLAMSSRNIRLTEQERKESLILSQILFYIQEKFHQHPILALKQETNQMMKQFPLLNLEYLELFNSETLLPITNQKDAKSVVVCIAAKIGAVRLIDNLIIS